MNLSQARKILGISDNDSSRTIKTKYHRLITKYHPDVAGNNTSASLTYTQMINEAYHIIQTAKDSDSLSSKNFSGYHTSSKKSEFSDMNRNLWKQNQTVDLFTEREIYVIHEIYGESYESHIATGKYLWDPDAEDFTLFLKSINRLCNILLDHAFEKAEFSHLLSDEKRNIYHQKLFHVLSEHYMDPYDCLQKLVLPRHVDDKGRKIFRFRAFLSGKKKHIHYYSLCALSSGDSIYPHAVENNRLLVRNERGELLGHLSLEKDAYYLCLIPLFKKRQAQIRMHVCSIPEAIKLQHTDILVHIDLDVRINSELLPRDRKNEIKIIQKILNLT